MLLCRLQIKVEAEARSEIFDREIINWSCFYVVNRGVGNVVLGQTGLLVRRGVDYRQSMLCWCEDKILNFFFFPGF